VKRVSVNANAIRDNRRDGGARPPVLLWDSATQATKPYLGVDFVDESGAVVFRVVYDPDNPHDHAEVWVETDLQARPVRT
jgi:hypothetical protein